MAVRLFLGFAYLRKNELGKADAHLTPFVNLEPDRRLAAQAERTIKVVRSESLSERCARLLLRRAAPGGAYAPGVAPPPVTSDAC
jgi:hypothetical protein